MPKAMMYEYSYLRTNLGNIHQTRLITIPDRVARRRAEICMHVLVPVCSCSSSWRSIPLEFHFRAVAECGVWSPWPASAEP
jgi:hypothetical protein